MTKLKLLERLESLTDEEQVEWMLALGANLTVAARGAYEVGTDKADGSALRGFNEIQHRVYGRIDALKRGEKWTMHSFIDMILGHSEHFGIEGDIGWALRRSLPPIPN